MRMRATAKGEASAAVSLADRGTLRGLMMIVKQIWTGNSYRNFNYLIACAETGEALAVDPLDADKCIAAAKDAGWTITQILNTRDHRFVAAGMVAVLEAM